MEEQKHCPFPSCPDLTEDQIHAIATKAAKVALEQVYTEIGRSVVSKFLWLAGAAALAIYAFMKGKGVV